MDGAVTRRDFLKASTAAAAGTILGGSAVSPMPLFAQQSRPTRPNVLLICCDQMNIDATSAYGNPWVSTPNLDRLIGTGVSFMESHSTNPVCSPARSSLLTGRMPVETGVVTNDLPIRSDIPTIGQWFQEQGGYETVYCGKWHLPDGYPPANLPGWKVLPVGAGQGDLVDNSLGRSMQAYLHNRNGGRGRDPYVAFASFMQPHDICYWAIMHQTLVPGKLPFDIDPAKLPELPPNNTVRPPAPAKLNQQIFSAFGPEQWRYYLYIYYRMVEMLDADVGRLLQAVEESGEADNTYIIFTSDHGEGAGRHSHVQKWYPYEESVKVPLIISSPDRMNAGVRDTEHLVSGLDLMPTICDWAGVPAPAGMHGASLRPLLEGNSVQWRDFLVTEHHVDGRMVRTPDFKFVHYKDDPVEQLFQIKEDPWEMANLYQDSQYADVMDDHRQLLAEWRAQMDPAPGVEA